MSSVNKVILLGRLGRDPEVRYLDSQRAVATFTLATSEYYKDKSGQRVEQTEWHDIEAWDDLAKLAEKYLHKGNSVFLEGKIRTNNWKDKDGNERTTKRIRITSMTLIGGGNAQSTGNTAESKPANPDASVTEDLNDELPF